MRQFGGWRVGVTGLGLAIIFVCLAGTAAAAPNQGPDPADFTGSNRYGNSYPGVPRTVDYDVATSAFNTILQTTLKVYLPAPNGQIVIHNQNICYATFTKGGRNADQLDDGVINSAGNAVSYRIGATVQWGAFDGSAGCDNKTLTFTVSGAVLDPNTGMYPYTLLVSANPAADKYSNTFWVTGPAGAIVSQDSSLPTSSFGMNQTSPVPGGVNPDTTQNPPNPYKDYTNWVIRFAPDCSVTTPTVNKRIEIYDDDNHNNWDVQPRPFLVKLREYNRAGVFQGELTPTITLPDGGTWSNAGGGYYDVYAGNGKRIWLNYTLKRDMIYQWWVDSVYYDNTLQFKIPYDNVYYYRQCQTGNFNLQPNINAVINGGAATGNVAEVGDSLTFTYGVANSGSTASTAVNCTIYGKTYAGYQAVPAPPDSSSDPGYVPPPTGCPRSFPVGNTPNLATETIAPIPASSLNKTICRSLWVDPATPGGTAKGTEVCVLVANKPYMRVYGGDVSAGNGLLSAGTCSSNNEAAIVSWNKEGGSYAGAGVQFASYALGQIVDFATALGNAGGAAPPNGLAFANTAASGSLFGGSFGSLPCLPDFYGTPSANPLPTGNVASASLLSGAYTASGLVTLNGGMIPTVKRISIYVAGDVVINGNIQYPASWTAADVPLIEIVAKGNIYIGSNVTQLDGVYVAQRSGTGGGVIYTCAQATTPVATTAVATLCNTRLTVNGAFAAHQVQFLRTLGTLRQSAPAETGASGAAAEVFNYGPAVWMPQPMGLSGNNKYDAITSLPPVL